MLVGKYRHSLLQKNKKAGEILFFFSYFEIKYIIIIYKAVCELKIYIYKAFEYYYYITVSFMN